MNPHVDADMEWLAVLANKVDPWIDGMGDDEAWKCPGFEACIKTPYRILNMSGAPWVNPLALYHKLEHLTTKGKLIGFIFQGLLRKFLIKKSSFQNLCGHLLLPKYYIWH